MFACQPHAALMVARREERRTRCGIVTPFLMRPATQEIEPALQATRRALFKGILRERWMHGPACAPGPLRLQVPSEIAKLVRRQACRSV